jgi:hypothetical protein
VLAGQGRHELASPPWGAPLTELKRLKAEHPVDRHRILPSRVCRKGRVRRKRLLRRAWADLPDEIEGLFD